MANPQSPDNPIGGNQDTIPTALKQDLVELTWLRKLFDDARELTSADRTLSERDRDYYDGPEQLNSDVRRTLKGRGQPAIYINRVRPAIDGVLGVLEGSKVDPRALPRNPVDDDSANVATKALRFITDSNRFQEVKLDCAENFLIEGTCAAIFEWDGRKVVANQIRWEEFFFDPYSRRPDFKDARYLGSAKWMDLAVVRKLYPQAAEQIGDLLTPAASAMEATWQDRPESAGAAWVDRRRQRIMVVELYYNDGSGWHRYLYCGAGTLESGPSAYIDVRTGETRCPIEAESCYVDRKNGRYGRIRDMICIQDEVNARRSRLLHLANSRQVQQSDPAAAPVDAKIARAEAAKADGVIPAGWQIVPTADIASGQALLLQESKSEIERMGPTPAVLGKQGDAAQSGRARLVLQQAGMTELARPIGRIEDWENRSFRQMWMLAQQYQTAPWWIRVTDDPRSPEFLQVNEPVMGEDGQPVMQIVPGPNGQPIVQPQMRHRIAEMDMDIIIDSTPDTASLAQEVWTDLLELARTVPIGSPQFMIALEMSPLPNKREVIEKLEAWQAKQAEEQANPAQEMAMQLEFGEKQAAINNKNADTEKKQAETAQTYFEIGRDSVGEQPVEQPAAPKTGGE